MSQTQIRRMAILAVITAANIALSFIVRIPTPATGGYVSTVDAGIFLVALLGGKRSGMIVGGLSGLLLDIIASAPEWMLFSLVIHGLEGYLVGQIGARKPWPQQVLALVVGSLVMIIGYVFAGAILVSWAAGVGGMLGNLGQVAMGLVVALIMMPILKNRKEITKYL
ncbi:ECF transporter S component [Eupransor demetentiae]|uniref:Membrane (S) component (ECF-S) n=1 Tax=Eupransor demetentiae TaxID=3109584 RepID=A0ABM9N5I5_9LACO|nr:ECF-type riboflavin transporter [Lactobacillaceae bacterium LMG 33000]